MRAISILWLLAAGARVLCAGDKPDATGTSPSGEAALFGDMPVVQACALIFAAAYILLNLSADIVSIVTNPRLLHPK